MLKKLSPLVHEEISLVAYVDNVHKLSPDITSLKHNGIIPLEWQEEKSKSDGIIFTNSLSITQESERIVFAQSFDSYILEPHAFITLVNNYLTVFHNLDCKKIEVRPTSFFRFDLNEEGNHSAGTYLYSQILLTNGLSKFTNKSIQSNLSLLFNLDKCLLTLEIQDIIFPSFRETPERSGIFIYGNFCYEVVEGTSSFQNCTILEAVSFFQNNIDTYHELVKLVIEEGK
jgi:hypothetical protein